MRQAETCRQTCWCTAPGGWREKRNRGKNERGKAEKAEKASIGCERIYSCFTFMCFGENILMSDNFNLTHFPVHIMVGVLSLLFLITSACKHYTSLPAHPDHLQRLFIYFVCCYNQLQDVPRICRQDADRGARYEICIVLWEKTNKKTAKSLIQMWTYLAHSPKSKDRYS